MSRTKLLNIVCFGCCVLYYSANTHCIAAEIAQSKTMDLLNSAGDAARNAAQKAKELSESVTSKTAMMAAQQADKNKQEADLLIAKCMNYTGLALDQVSKNVAISTAKTLFNLSAVALLAGEQEIAIDAVADAAEIIALAATQFSTNVPGLKNMPRYYMLRGALIEQKNTLKELALTVQQTAKSISITERAQQAQEAANVALASLKIVENTL